MIAVTFALPDESRVFLKLLQDLRQISCGSLPLYLGKLNDLEIAVLHTGVGTESAQTRILGFLANHHPELVLSSGFAGALDPSLQIGSLVVADNISSPVILDSALRYFRYNHAVFFGALTTQPVAAESVASKQLLASETGALAVDMETSILAKACAEASIPFISMRIISDTALQPLPLPFSFWFDPVKQKARVLSLLLYLAGHPGVIPDFIKFVRGVFKAKKSLAGLLRDFITDWMKNRICSQT